MEIEKLIIYSDGGARGNPGPGGAGVVFYNKNKKKIKELSKFLGIVTNNQAEYAGLILALQEAVKLGAKIVDIFLDSELVVKQLKGEYRVKNKELKKFYLKAINLINKIQSVNFFYLPRRDNKVADNLVNQVIDKNI